MGKKLVAEFLGTFALVFLAVGSAVIGLESSGNLSVALAFGFVLIFAVYAFGPVSGCHINPAVTLAMIGSRKMPIGEAGAYMVAQVLGAIAGSALTFALVDLGVLDETGAYGANAYGPATGGAAGAFILETTLTAIFVLVVLLATDKFAAPLMAGLAIGTALTAVHLVGIPLTGTSVNPARSIGPALFAGGDALSQLWLFILAPLIGGLIAAGIYMIVRREGVPPVTPEVTA